MNEEQIDVKQYDHWLKDDSDVAALVMRQWLTPVEGKDAVIFPPTYAKPEKMQDDAWTGYNIDKFNDGSSICQIDSVGSQANRMEPIFKREKYKHLVPQVIIQVVIKVKTNEGERNIHLLDVGHRAADAIVRFSDKIDGDPEGKALGELLWNAFKAWQKFGDAEPLARIAPTSLVFGAWDSRATQAKVPRIVRSVIRAYNVRTLTRSAVFSTPLHYVNEGVIDESLDKGKGEKNPLSQEGFLHSLASGSHGGIEVLGEIRRDVSLNLVALRSLGVKQQSNETPEQSTERTIKLRRYILGLSLVAVTHRDGQMFNLREGCLLRIAKSSPWKAVPFDGEDMEIPIPHESILKFAESAAKDFNVRQFDKPFPFSNVTAETWLKRTSEERDKDRHQDAVIKKSW